MKVSVLHTNIHGLPMNMLDQSVFFFLLASEVQEASFGEKKSFQIHYGGCINWKKTYLVKDKCFVATRLIYDWPRPDNCVCKTAAPQFFFPLSFHPYCSVKNLRVCDILCFYSSTGKQNEIGFTPSWKSLHICKASNQDLISRLCTFSNPNRA